MTSLASGNHCSWPIGVNEQAVNARCNKVPTYLAYGGTCFPSKRFYSLRGQNLGAGAGYYCQHFWRHRSACQSVADDGVDPDDSEHDTGDAEEKKCDQEELRGVDVEIFRESLERIAGTNDYAFSGRDLATLIREKYGRSYDVLLIKKEFMGRNLLALNVMWKYVEQRSFPLTEEEYLLRLDDVANTLKCWGAVSHIRSSISKLKERPRIGKAVSIFIDMDESGGRANEWIYK